jgi:hypothetical protein
MPVDSQAGAYRSGRKKYTLYLIVDKNQKRRYVFTVCQGGYQSSTSMIHERPSTGYMLITQAITTQ